MYQELSLVPDLSVADNMFLSREPKRFGLVDRARILREARAFLEGRGFPLDPKAIVRTLPFAYRQLTEIAKAPSSGAAETPAGHVEWQRIPAPNAYWWVLGIGAGAVMPEAGCSALPVFTIPP